MLQQLILRNWELLIISVRVEVGKLMDRHKTVKEILVSTNQRINCMISNKRFAYK